MSEMKYASVFKSMLCCLKGECEKCPCKDERNLYGGAVDCLDILFDNATRIFEEKDAEIERLNAINKVLKDNNHKCHRLGYEDAITEFAERLKAEAVEVDVSMGYGNECWQKAVTEWEIDQIAKEMKGEENG